jgi:Tol biopolymer transport system component
MSLPIDPESGLGAGPPRQVSIDKCWAWLDVSPDGEWIVFSRGPLRPAILVIPSAGGAARKVAEELTGRPLWSAAGKSIYYDVDLPLGAGSALVRASVDGKTTDTVFTWPRRIGPDFESRFLLREIRERQPNHPTVWELATLDGHPLGRFELPPGMDVYGATPAGEFLAIRHDGVAPLEVLLIDGGSPQRLSEARGMDKVLGWTPDGQRVLFQTNLDGDEVFFLASTDRGPMRQVRLREQPHDAFAPVLSADGRHLLYAVEGPETETTTLKILDIENERTREISRDHFLPEWASSEFALSGRGGSLMRDGDDFLYIERHDDRFELWATPPAGQSRLLRTFHGELPDHIGVHGDRIAYVVDRSLMLARAGQGQARPLATQRQYWDATWSLDGTRLAARDGMMLHVLEIDASGQLSGEPTALATPDRWWWSLSWLPNGRGFLVQGENGNVWRISTEPEVRPVAITEDLPSGSVWDFKVSPDGRSIAYARSTLQGSSIWRVDLGDALAGIDR